MTNFNDTSDLHWNDPAPSERTGPARTLLTLISWYQQVHAGRIAPCRFYPSCSVYAHEAVEVHGFWRGGALALRRVSKCRPLGPHGIDLVPLPKKDRKSTS